ncbi:MULTISPECIES: hypothetical protein [Rhodopseudomonas]|uniref:Uncharacterized protein n=1 Tax=Rhodopseudomonas palustris TaxID=1076 RepID=A0A0D7E230_RHOPL|nr:MULTISPECIES: hypothetical protein [Rhodopseudomonas]KIZ34878.1 hypothetical protein OO17_26245 [Rhodopseudomonas palustris]MDF3809639.1 hypothetical protein [Rhodopseudomonas sp. BAL398]WOK17282.1 hypothetical protein RBJ75_24700 [Rhodopseudomonas sp. BAL398]
MRHFIRPVAVALGVGCLAMSFAAGSSTNVYAQAKQAAPAAADDASEPAIKQIPLTEKQIQGVLAAHTEIDAVTAKLADKPDAEPDAKTMAQLDAIAKKNGLASYDEYILVLDNISLVLSEFDPTTKKHIGAEGVIKQQIATVQADKNMSAEDKKATLADLNEALKSPAPPIQNKGNIELVAKYYDKLNAAMSEEAE